MEHQTIEQRLDEIERRLQALAPAVAKGQEDANDEFAALAPSFLPLFTESPRETVW